MNGTSEVSKYKVNIEMTSFIEAKLKDVIHGLTRANWNSCKSQRSLHQVQLLRTSK